MDPRPPPLRWEEASGSCFIRFSATMHISTHLLPVTLVAHMAALVQKKCGTAEGISRWGSEIENPSHSEVLVEGL